MQIVLYAKVECGLCDELKADLEALALDPALRAVGLTIREIDIEQDKTLHEKFRYLVPVLALPDGTLHYPPHDYLATRTMLIQAAAQQSPSEQDHQSEP